MPYKGSGELVKNIQRCMIKINLKAMGFDDDEEKKLNTHVFSDEQRNSKEIDYITGFECMDSEFRMIVLEGLRGDDKGIEMLY